MKKVGVPETPLRSAESMSLPSMPASAPSVRLNSAMVIPSLGAVLQRHRLHTGFVDAGRSAAGRGLAEPAMNGRSGRRARQIGRPILLAAFTPFLALACVSCSPASSSGVIVGVVDLCTGGVTSASPAGLTRMITLQRGGHVVRRKVVSAPFHFRFTVKPGPYRVLAQGDKAVNVHLKAGGVITVRPETKCHLVG